MNGKRKRKVQIVLENGVYYVKYLARQAGSAKHAVEFNANEFNKTHVEKWVSEQDHLELMEPQYEYTVPVTYRVNLKIRASNLQAALDKADEINATVARSGMLPDREKHAILATTVAFDKVESTEPK